jgi:heme oxygenase (biliverdin-IX-beta and delta-forming)
MTIPVADVRAARKLLQNDRAMLATLTADGWPYGSLVLSAQDDAGFPVLLLSDLAEHTRNIRRDPRASLLFDGTVGSAAPLAGPRLTVLGEIAPASEVAARERYMSRHADAASWAAMADFRLYRLTPARAHLVAGFGRIAWLEPSALFSSQGSR